MERIMNKHHEIGNWPLFFFFYFFKQTVNFLNNIPRESQGRGGFVQHAFGDWDSVHAHTCISGDVPSILTDRTHFFFHFLLGFMLPWNKLFCIESSFLTQRCLWSLIRAKIKECMVFLVGWGMSCITELGVDLRSLHVAYRKLFSSWQCGRTGNGPSRTIKRGEVLS